MDIFEGIHRVQLSCSPPARPRSVPGYELLVAGNSGIAVYSSPTFFGNADLTDQHTAEGERCPVGRLVDLEPEERDGGQRKKMPPEEAGAHRHEAYDMSRLRSSSLEIKEKGTEFLRDQLDAAQKELKLKDEECVRLSHVRNQLEQELEELTASLFEEAHKMVREANVKQAAAEKQLKEAQGKIDVLQAEVSALKTLVLTSTPASPNRQLHPQLLSPGSSRARGHTRNKSASGALQLQTEPPPTDAAANREDRELDSVLFAEFLSWKEKPGLDRSSAFIGRVFREDIGPCLSFTCSELSQSVQCAVENNSLTIEPVAMSSLPTVKDIECGGPNKCALSGMSRPCRHRIKLGDKENYYYISPSSRARITAVCNFFTYIRYIQQGLVRQDVQLMFWEVMRLRREMSVAKLGYFLTEES
ncbi:guanine nucleotide exchange factor for Rab-3A isoform X2 [Pimephales promelas]|uniref:guanine nucleotide exchange factor for Rab-3A isoform X2 n=1 Tax=Pimephales promelas TaxID=90988 RepID=UPI001955E023|nr:guanine nucleotide exchange factor for Rab-3A isoform X2 [Pimephales promelas]KAG1957583.1 guanine nucleotide exchange factor for Rab-3A [Pimephales promelas]